MRVHLDKYIRVETNTPTIVKGDPQDSWSTYGDMWAMFLYKTTKTDIEDSTRTTQGEIEAIIRYDNAILPSMRFYELDNTTTVYYIHGKSPLGRKKYLVLKAQEDY